MKKEKHLSPTEFAKLLTPPVTPRQVRRMIAKGVLKAQDVGMKGHKPFWIIPASEAARLNRKRRA